MHRHSFGEYALGYGLQNNMIQTVLEQLHKCVCVCARVRASLSLSLSLCLSVCVLVYVCVYLCLHVCVWFLFSEV